MQAANFNGNESGQLNFQYINLPVFLKYMSASHIFAETGPQVGFLISANENILGTQEVNADVKSQYTTADFAWTLGLGYQLPIDLGFDVRYNLGLTNIAKNTDNILHSGSIKNDVIQVDVYYLFPHSSGK